MSDSKRTTPPPPPFNEKSSAVTTGRPRASSNSSNLSLRSPRTPRFAEATSVYSPIEPPKRNPFKGPPIVTTTHLTPQPQPADVGFGYMSSNQLKHTSIEVPLTPKTPMRSALRAPGTPGRFIDPRSPTFKEEVKLEKEEFKTEKQNAADLKVKKRVRVAKFFLRGVNFSCSLIVISMLTTIFTIFNATRSLTPRSNSPPWAPNQQTWPQITLLVIASVSLAMCVLIFWSYWKGGHRKAEKTAVYYTSFAIGFFIFSIVMWIVAAVILQQSRKNGDNKDMWGWACNNNRRETLFEEEVNYALVCRLHNWTLICALIEIVIEVLTISIYAYVFYRVWSKRKLHKSMDMRDKARSDLYLAQLRAQSAPNTPGFAKSPMSATFRQADDAERGSLERQREGTQYAETTRTFNEPKPFHLQAPPVKITSATPEVRQEGFEHAPTHGAEQKETTNEHVGAAPGEETYDAVPIPGAYASPLNSPGFGASQPMGFPNMDGTHSNQPQR